jgi:3-methyladenine DNA glycosylase/8-oxoguanine DNA glycosylase
MLELTTATPAPFHFGDVVLSHGWLRLLPYDWNAETETLSRTIRFSSGRTARVEMTACEAGVRVRSDADPEHAAVVTAQVRWVLALDDDLAGFHQACGRDPILQAAAQRGQGRILRCPTVWEDAVKTLFSVNTAWRQTVAMTRNFVTRYGGRHEDGARAFPEPEAVAALDPKELQEVCRIGYRAEPLNELARALAEGRLDLEALKDSSLPDEEVEARLRSLRGFGPYAAANIMLLLGRYDHLPVDSWFRKTVRNAWFGGRDATDRELVAAFERFRPYRTLAYYFYDWQGAMRTAVWRD